MNLRNPLSFLLSFLLLTGFVHAQGTSLRNDIPVKHNSTTLANPWVGGFNMPQISKIDLNGDNKKDLFVFERLDNSVSCYLNKGTAGQVKYEYAPEYADSFPDTLFGWVMLIDFNNDGYNDIWTGTPDSRVRVFKNKMGSTGKLQFEIAEDKILSKYFPTLELELFSSAIDYPGIADLDGDGDLDFLTFDVLGGVIEWHKNVSVDSGFGVDSLKFVMQSSCFGHFHEGGANCIAFLNDAPCGTGMITNDDIDQFRKKYEQGPDLSNRAHSGSTITALDLDGNGLKDLLIGDIGCGEVYAVYNHGTTAIAHFDSVQYLFPAYDTPIEIPIFVGTYYVDIDNDGKRDLTAAPTVNGGSENLTSLWYYRNKGTDNSPVFEFVQEAFLQADMIEVGSGSAPALFDYNNDGLLDLLIGNYGVFDSMAATPITSFYLYENTGSLTNPEYTLIDDDFAGLAVNPNFALLDHITPTLGDLDGDGDDDLLFGERFGKIYHYENTATTGNPANFTYVSANYAGIDVGDFSAPFLYDLDGDLDLDLLIGDKTGHIQYFENQGTASSPSFVFVTDTLGNINIKEFPSQAVSDGYAKPYMFDYDQDSVDELLVGTSIGTVEIYENVTATPGAAFTYVGDLYDRDFGSYSAPTGAILENNAIPTFMVGTMRGGLQLMGETPMVGNDAGPIGIKGQFVLYPNPAKNQVIVRYDGKTGSGFDTVAMLTNTLGQHISSSKFNGNTAAFDLSQLQAGIYFVTVKTNGYAETLKLVVQ